MRTNALVEYHGPTSWWWHWQHRITARTRIREVQGAQRTSYWLAILLNQCHSGVTRRVHRLWAPFLVIFTQLKIYVSYLTTTCSDDITALRQLISDQWTLHLFYCTRNICQYRNSVCLLNKIVLLSKPTTKQINNVLLLWISISV